VSRLTRGQAALIARQQAGAAPSGTITYTRAAGGTVDLTGKAWVGRTVFRRNPLGSGEATIQFGDRDYLIPVADLAAGGTPFQPAEGDRITETVGAASLVFEILAPTGEPAARHSDPQRTVWRVHCKQQVG